jgi:PAS domain S-box-containing protein
MSPADVGMNEQKYAKRPRKSLEEELDSLHRQLKEQQEEIDRCSGIERSLRESEEKYRFLVENSGDIIWKIDVNGRWMFISSNVEKVTGYKPGEIVGKTIWDFVEPEYHDQIKKMLKKRALGEKIPPYEVNIIAKDGRCLPFEVSTNPIRDNSGEIVGTQGISRDISYRKQSEARLREYYDELEGRVEQRTADLDKALSTLRTILETVPIGLVVADRESENITYFSKDAAEIFKSDITGKAVGPEDDTYKLLRPDGSPFPTDELPLVRSLRHGERVTNVEILVLRKDGSEVTILASSAPVLDPTGKITAAVASISDITCLKHAEAALRDEKEQAELYIDLMGHDINNLNHIAMGYIEIALDILKRSGKLDMGEVQLMEKPLDMLKNSSELIDNVRKIQRIREGDLKYEIVDLYELLYSVKSEYSHIPGRAVDISLQGRGPAPVMANPLLKDVFTNLVGNAIKHSTGQLKIDITLDEVTQGGKKYYRVAVEDNGPGIPDTYKKTLISRKKLGGKGLGLYLVKTFVKQFKGRFRIEDRVSGDYSKGAKFVVMLPAADI